MPFVFSASLKTIKFGQVWFQIRETEPEKIQHTENDSLYIHVKGKGKGRPITGHEESEGEQMYSSTLPSTSALDGGGWSTSRPGRFTPRKYPVPIVQEAGWAPGPVWTGVENLAPTGIRSPDRPARNEELYRLS